MLPFLLVILYLINWSVLLSLLATRRGEVGMTLAWTLVLLLLPGLGVLLYFYCGATARYKLAAPLCQPPEDFLAAIPLGKPVQPPGCEDLVRLCGLAEDGQCLAGNRAELLQGAVDKYGRMLSDIAQAKHSVNVLYFIIKPEDQSGKAFLDLLEQKAREGVQVRLIYDAFGFITSKKKQFLPLRQAGGQVRRYLPSFWRNVAEANYRMHRKIVVVDGTIAYTGGINIGDDYLGFDPKVRPWQDASIRIEGPAAGRIQLRFVRDWAKLGKQAGRGAAAEDWEGLRGLFPPAEPCGHMAVQLVAGGPDRHLQHVRDCYQRMISSARQYIYIQTPYLAPDESLLSTLRLAAQAGVDVRVMLPGVPDKPWVFKVSMAYAGELLRAGVKVTLYPGFLHSKLVVMDDRAASVGSANLDIRSFALDFELNAMVYDREFAQTCRQAYLHDQQAGYPMTLEQYLGRAPMARLREGLWRLLAPLV